MNKNRGFSLLELLIVTAILVVISVIGAGFYINYAKNIEIKSITENVMFDLKQVQSKSMIGEGGYKWGIHFVNDTLDYYEIFSTPTDYSDGGKVIISKKYLSNNVIFTEPASSGVKDVIFNKISGGTTATSIILSSLNVTRTISILSIGTISIQ